MRFSTFLLLFFSILSCGEIEISITSNKMVKNDRSIVLKPNFKNLVKDFNESEYRQGYQYMAFFSGAVFQGNEIHVGRIGNGHIWVGERGVLCFYVIKDDGRIETIYPGIDYSTVVGELRDPNITVSRDGEYLYLSSYSCDRTPQLKQSWLYILDKELNIVGSNLVSQKYIIWGNTLETRDHYLLKTAYENTKIHILRSNEKITDTSQLSFSIIHTFENPGLILSEASMAYTAEKLVLIMRTSQSSYYIETKDLSGQDGWSQWYSLGRTIHSPALLPYQDSNECSFMGGLVKNTSSRQPCFGVIDTNASSLVFFEVIDNTVNGFGGYPSFVNCGHGVFSTMYYDDFRNTKTAVYYQRFLMYEKRVGD